MYIINEMSQNLYSNCKFTFESKFCIHEAKREEVLAILIYKALFCKMLVCSL